MCECVLLPCDCWAGLQHPPWCLWRLKEPGRIDGETAWITWSVALSQLTHGRALNGGIHRSPCNSGTFMVEAHTGMVNQEPLWILGRHGVTLSSAWDVWALRISLQCQQHWAEQKSPRHNQSVHLDLSCTGSTLIWHDKIPVARLEPAACLTWEFGYMCARLVTSLVPPVSIIIAPPAEPRLRGRVLMKHMRGFDFTLFSI